MVQSIHASIEVTKKYNTESESSSTDSKKEWEHPHLVLCGVKNEQSLINAIMRLEKYGIPYAYFSEPDIQNQITAIATFPLCGKQREVMSSYRLLSFEENNYQGEKI